MSNQIKSRHQRAIQPFVQKRMALALAAAFSMPTVAATVTWDGGGNNSFWSTATNWDGNVLPGALDSVLIGSGFSVVHNSGTTSILSLNASNLGITSSSLSMSAASSISQLMMTNATLANSATTTFGSATLTASTLNGSGKTILSSGGNHNIGGTGYTYSYLNQGHTLQNEGQLQMSSSGTGQKYLYITGSSNGVAASRLVNKGEMTLAADANASVQINRNGGNADAAFDNSNKLTKNGAGLASINTQFNNTGNVVLNDGILALEGGSSHSAASGISGNGTLRLGNGTHSFADGFVSHAGLTQLQSGTLQGVAGGSLTFLGSLEGAGGTIRDAALLQAANTKLNGTTIKDVAEARLGKADLTGVTLSGNGKTILSSGGNHNIGGTGYTYSYLNQGHTLQNEGQLQMSSSGTGQKYLYITGSSNGVAASRLVNKGEMTLAADANASVQINRNGGNADAAFDNSNKLTKNGAGLASINTQFNNTGNVVLNDGILALEGGSSHSAASGISGNGTLRLGNGTHSFADGFVSYAGLTQLQSGTLQGVAGGSLTFLGALEINGGTIRDAAVVQIANAKLTGATLSGNGKTILSSGGNHNIGGTGYTYSYLNQGHTLQNEGQLQMSSSGTGQKYLYITGSSNGVAASRLVNKGEMTLAADANASVQINRNGGNADAAFDNSNKLTKNGAGLASINTQFNNTGNVVLNDGILALEGGSSHSAASGISGNGTLRLGNGTHSFADGFVSHAGLTQLQSGTLQGVAGGSLTFLGALEGMGAIRDAGLLQVGKVKLTNSSIVDVDQARLGNAELIGIQLRGNGNTVLDRGGNHSLASNGWSYSSLQRGHVLQNDGSLQMKAMGSTSNYLYLDGSSTGVAASRLLNKGDITLSTDSSGGLKISRYIGNNDVVFENSGKLLKDGSGIAIIENVKLLNSGDIQIQQGKLLVNGPSMQNSGSININAGATLSGVVVNSGHLAGNGTVGSVENHGIVAPGASAGTLSITGNYVQGADGRLDIDLGGLLPGVDFDRLQVSGNATLNGVLDVTHLAGYAPKIGDSFIVLASSRLYGSFSSLSLHGFGSGMQINVSYLDGNDADSYADYVRLDVAAVPEPETYAMMLAGLGVVGWSLRKRKLAMH